MRRLLWKELNEVRWWAAALALVPSALVAMGHPLCFRGEMVEQFVAVWAVGGFLFGAATYSRELAWDTARFTYSRPVRWWNLWLVKFAVGLIVCIAAAAIPAVAYRLTCPDIYLPFADFSSLASATGGALLTVGIAFVLGLGCSAVMPGLSLTLAVAGVSLLFCTVVFWIQSNVLHRRNSIELLGILLTLVIASLLNSRRLTQPCNERLRLYAITCVTGFLLLFFLGLPFSETAIPGWRASMSPDQNYIVAQGSFKETDTRRYVLKKRAATDRKSDEVEKGWRIVVIGWSPDSKQFLYLLQARKGGEVTLKSLHAQSQRTTALAKIPVRWQREELYYYGEAQGVSWSLSGRRVVFAIPSDQATQQDWPLLGFLCNLRTHTVESLPKEVTPGGYSSATWWLDEHTILSDQYPPYADLLAYNLRTHKTRVLIKGDLRQQSHAN